MDKAGKRRLGASGLNSQIEPRIAKGSSGGGNEQRAADVRSVSDTTSASDGEATVGDVGDQHPRALSGRDLGDEVADGAGAGDDDITPLQIAATGAGMNRNRQWLHEATLVVSEVVRKRHDALGRNVAEFTPASVGLEAADPQ